MLNLSSQVVVTAAGGVGLAAQLGGFMLPLRSAMSIRDRQQ
jgi:hypothetical protein